MANEVVVQRVGQGAGVPADNDFRIWAEAALAGRRTGASLTIRIVDEDESRRLNQEYRGTDAPTNVLSFEADLPGEVRRALGERGKPQPLGDLVICTGVVAREAVSQAKPARDHWAHLVVHGVLHLLGFDHAASGQAREMESLERELLAGLGIPDPYRAR
jgi:probable rRNA maturation factor